MEFRKSFGNKALSIMIILSFVLIGPLCILTAGQAGPSGSRSSPLTTTEDWPMFRYSPNRDGVTNAHGPLKDTLLWSNTSGANVYSSPAVVDGRLFFGASDGKVWAFDANSGKLLWSNTTSSGGEYGTSSSPAVYNGSVIIYSNDDHSLYSFNTSTGKRNWKVSLGSGSYGGSSPVVVNGKIYVGSVDDHLYVRNFNDGSAAWSFQIGVTSGNGYGVESSPAVVGDRVYFGGGDDVFRVVNITTHALVWSKPLASYGYPSPSVVGNAVYFADGSYASSSCAGCNIYAYKLDGTLLWKRPLITGAVSSPTYYKGYIFIGSNNQTVYALNATDGSLVWSYKTGGDVFSSPSVSNDIVYIGSKDHKLYAFDYNGFADGNDGWTGEAKTGAQDGDILWNHTLSGEVWASPSLSDGIAYITDLSNKVWALGTPYVNITTPQVISTIPSDKATNVSLSTTVNAHLSQALDPLTVTAANFTLKDSGGNSVAGTVSYDSGNKNISFNPGALLKPHEKYSVSVKSLKNQLGNMMPSPVNWSFTTIDGKPVLSLGAVTPATGNLTTVFQFSVLYADPDNDSAVGGVRLYLDGSTTAKTCTVNTSVTNPAYHDGNFVNGEAYVFITNFTTGGTHNFKFNVTDGFLVTPTQVFTGPVVTTPNKPPSFKTIPDQHVTEDVPYTFDLTPYVTDPDNTTAQIKLNVSFQYLTGVTGLNASFLFPNAAKDSYNIVFTVTDGINIVHTTVKFIVTHVDDAPVIALLKNVTVNASEPYKYDLSPYISDIDTPLSSMTVSTNSSYISVSGLNLTLNYPRTVAGEEVNVTVKDLTSTVYGDFWVSVYAPPINQPPIIDTLPGATPTEDVNYSYDLAPYIHDDGLPSGHLTVIVMASKYVTRDNLKLYMLYPDGVLTDKVNITVSDGELNRTASLKVTVKPVNDAPIIEEYITMREVYGPKDRKVPIAYSFNVTVGDIDSPNPIVSIIIDNTTYQMNKAGNIMLMIAGQPIPANHYTYMISNSVLTKGAHTYKFKVDDRSGAANAVQESPTHNFDVVKTKKTTTSPMSGFLPILLFVVVIIVVLVIIGVVLRRRRRGTAMAMSPQGQVHQVDLMAPPPVQQPPTMPPGPPSI